MDNEQCPNCGSSNTSYDEAFGFHKCEDCSELWAHDKDDPDYEDCEPSFKDACTHDDLPDGYWMIQTSNQFHQTIAPIAIVYQFSTRTNFIEIPLELL